MSEVIEAVRTPNVGDKLLVRHRSKSNKKGDVGLEPTKPEVKRIKTVMLDGDVTTASGDLWKVKRSTESGADWMTVGLER